MPERDEHVVFFRFENRTGGDLTNFVEYVTEAKQDFQYDGTIDGWDRQWTMPNALLFTVSIMTVIGEGGREGNEPINYDIFIY